MTIEDVSRHLGMGWDTVKEIHLLALRTRLKRRRLRHLRLIGVDEAAVRKGHNLSDRGCGSGDGGGGLGV